MSTAFFAGAPVAIIRKAFYHPRAGNDISFVDTHNWTDQATLQTLDRKASIKIRSNDPFLGLHFAVVVAVSFVRVMQVTLNQVVRVVAMGDCFMPAAGPMLMRAIVR